MAKKVKVPKISNEVYEAEIFRMQTELVKLQEWARQTGARILVIFEGRDAAGKGGAIKRITEYLSPRVARIVALPTPTERERGQWYFQRYIAHLPGRGEIVLFDRSWYNRAGVEKVMGFCTPEEYYRFLRQTPIFEQMLIDDGGTEYKDFMNSVMTWLPFKSDESANQREKKWESFAGGSYHYNLEGELLDALDFIPKTSRNENYKNQNKQLESLDNLERWFAQRIADGNRNNQMIKFALALVDSGQDLVTVQTNVKAFNSKLSQPMTEAEIDSTIMVTVAKRYQSKP